MEKREAGKIQRKSDKAVKEETDKKSSAEWQREEEYLNQTPSLGFSTIFF